MPNAQLGNQTTIRIGSTNIGEVVSIGAVSIATDAVDVSTLASTMREFQPGMSDAGEVNFTGHFFPGDVGQSTLRTANQNKTTNAYTIEFPGNLGSVSFNGFITNYSILDATNDDPVAFEITVKITGGLNIGTVAVAGLSALTLTGTAGVLSPAFANNKLNYSWTFTTLSSITVTPTGASQTMDIYADGVLVQENLASGATSNAIIGFAAAATSRRIDIVAKEAGKSPVMYTVVAVRTS
jgi:hypothetical protein